MLMLIETLLIEALRHIGQFFAETFWSLRYFGHLSHICIKTCGNSAHQPIFSDILTEMTIVFVHFKKKFCL